MAEGIRARDVMRTDFVQVRVDQTLGEGMAKLRAAQVRDENPNALVIVDAEGAFVGMLTAKLLIRVLVGTPPEEEAPEDDELLERARQRLADPIGQTSLPEIPVVGPDDRLITMIRRGIPTRLDFVPVVDAGRPVGLAPITEIFQAAASLALTPEHEGIRFDR